MRWAQEQRLRYVRDCLAERGRVNRSDLMATFRISMPQASHDLQLFLKLNPGVMHYDASSKAYVSHAPLDPDDGKDTRL